MAILSYLVFATAFAGSCWALWVTIAPQRGRILDLLLNGPVAPATQTLHVPARSTLRRVNVRPVRPSASPARSLRVAA